MLRLISKRLFKYVEVGRYGRYSMRMLQVQHKETTLELLSQEFNKKEPLALAYFKRFHEKSKHSLQYWRDYWRKSGNEFFVSNLSVGCFDQQSGQLLGTLLCKDITAIPQEFYRNLTQQNFKYPSTEFYSILCKEIEQPYQDMILKRTAKVAHLCAGSLKDEHMGKKLLHRMIYCNEYLAFRMGYQYTYSWASNLKSAVAFKKLEYFKLAELDVREYEFKGEKVFEGIAEEHKNQSLWMKKIVPFKEELPLKL